ncbi:MAG: NAD(P)/FAD-dependent oxidoreductase, partial [Spirochaetes bacterium]|nr:NAD(P)/FAD-dependent oxidoreductase [Spirochaetota bacterium]
MNNKPTVNIIGSGIGGLFCGAILAKHGLKVNVFEARLKIGGYATSWKRKDYLFDSSLHEFNGFYPDQKKLNAFRFLELFKKIKLINIPSPYYSVFKDLEFKVPHDYDAFIKKLINYFPDEEKNIKKVMNIIKNISIDVANFMCEKSQFEAIKNTPIKYKYLFRYFISTVYSLIWKKIKTPKLRTIIAQNFNYYSDDIKKINLIFFSAATHSYLSAAYWISGTSASLTNALKNIIEENNGKVYTYKRVSRINFKNKKAVSITVNNKEEYFSDITICNSPLKYTVENLIDKKNFPFFLRRKAINTISSTSLFSIYIGMSIDVKKIGINEFSYALNEIDDLYKINKNDKLINHSFRPITIAAFNLDNSLCPKDKTVVNVCVADNIVHWNKFKHDKTAYKKEKDRI